MSTESKIPSGESDQASGESADNKVDHKTYLKILSEKKNIQAKYQDMETRLSQYEQEKLESDGKLKELNEALKKRVQDSDAKLKETLQKVTLKSFKSEFSREAEKLGCVDPEMAYLACSFDDIEVTDDLDFSKDALAKKVQELSKQKSYLFKKDVRPMTGINPENQSGGNLDLSKLSDSDLKQLLASAK